jgi:AMIN domain-containing protein
VQTSGSLSAEPAPAAVSAPESVTRSTSDQIPGALSADAPAVPTRLEIRPAQSVKSAVAQKRTEHHGASHEQIVVNLNRFAHVNPKLLHHPDRIYFDLSPGIRPKLLQTADLRSESRLVQQIRIGHGKGGMTRVVLELRRPCQYLAKVSPTPPYQLIINVRAGRARGAM